ncbi:MAG TPA: flagellar biosynthesis protein FlhB [Bacillota bacterium]|nr:flagellar biosynthesis protein FlhB [Bacillota bacterium]
MNKPLDYRIPLNLQLFAGEKTEEATPKRKQEARKKGQVAKSQEFNSAVVLLAGFAALGMFSPFIYKQIMQFTNLMLGTLNREDLTVNSLAALFQQASVVTILAMLPVVGATLLAGVVANYAQVGVMFSPEALSMKLERLNPLEGLKRMLSLRSVAELIKSLLKIAMVGLLAYRTISANFSTFPKMIDMSISASVAFLGGLALQIGLEAAVLLLVLAIFDYLFQRFEFNKSLRMSKQEIKEEYKQVEGNPQVKGKIREKMRRMSMQRMMQEIPKADVVITNPTHFAVALRYDGETMAAPEVVGKGQDLMAQRIKEIAREHDVTIVENKPLAQALFKVTEIGDTVPPDLFQAVAEVLAFVYRLKRKGGRK